MSDLNIGSLLSSVSGANMPNSGNNNMSTLFSSVNTNKNAGTSDLLGISYTDMASIKNGSYQKLMKKYYSENNTQASKEDIEIYKKKQDVTADKAADLAASLDTLSSMKYTEDGREKLNEGLEDFVKKYNSLVSNASESTSSEIKQKTQWLSNMVKENMGTLSSIGIEFDGSKLEINKDKLGKANLVSIQDAFGNGINNLGSKISYKAEQVYSLAKTYGASATAYTNSGKYNRDYSQSANFTTTT